MTRNENCVPDEQRALWLIDQVLRVNETHPYALVGDTGSGKSFLLVAWALSCATGTPWLGHAVAQRNVIFVRPDGGMQDFTHRALAWAQLHPETPPPASSALALFDSSHMIDIMRPGSQAFQQFFQQVGQLVHAHSASLLILDEWYAPGLPAGILAQLLQESFPLTVLYSTMWEDEGIADEEPQRTATTGASQRIHLQAWQQVAPTGELAITVTLPASSGVNWMELEMVRVPTPGMRIDSFGETCVALVTREQE